MTVDEYIDRLKPTHREVAEELRHIVKEVAPAATETIKWRMPWFELNGLLCYMDSTKEHIRFGFYKGAEIPDPEGLLEGTGKTGRHIKLRDIGDITRGTLTEMLKEAVRLNGG